MTDQPRFPRGTRVQLVLHGEVRRAVLVCGEWRYVVDVEGGPDAKRVTCGEKAITEEEPDGRG